MKSLRDCYIAIVAALLWGSLVGAAEPLTVMTFNIRYGTAPDGENAWPHRKEMVVTTIKEQDPDLLGLQEALREQLDVIDAGLEDYVRVGVGREAAGGGEYSAVYYRRSRFDLQDAGTFWLSATPAAPGSKTWGNSLPRICTWVRLLERASGRRLLYFNTHWDHQSQPARLESAGLMAERIKQLCGDDGAVIVTGDLNAAPQNPAIERLIERGDVCDSFTAAHPDETELGTFNGFGKSEIGTKIDYVLVNDRWEVEDAQIVRSQKDGRYPSDHFPVTAQLRLKD